MNPSSGGPAQGIRNNIPFWRKYGLEANVLSLDDATLEFVIKDRIIGLGTTNNKWAYSPVLMPWLLENLSKYNVVLINGLWLYHSYAVTKAITILKKRAKVNNIDVPKVYIMPHGMLDPYFQKAPERRLKAIRNTIYWHIIEKYVISKADGILFTCEEELELAKTTFKGYTPKTTYNVGYGIITPPSFSNNQVLAFYSKCPAIVSKTFFLFLSRIHPKKGVDILIKAYAACYEYCIDKNIAISELVIAGPGMDTDYGRDLKVLLDHYPIIRDKVHFPGMLQGDAKWGAIYACEMFVLPSHQENFGIAIVEAMACHKAVLITNRVNIWREIKDSNSGIVVNDDLVSTTEGLIEWQKKVKQEKVAIENNAFLTYQTHFTAEATSIKFVNVLNTN